MTSTHTSVPAAEVGAGAALGAQTFKKRQSRLRRLALATAAVLAASGLVLSGCTITKEPTPEEIAAAEAKAAEEKAKLAPAISVKDGEKSINPAIPVTVKALEGTLTDVVMTNEDGKVVESEFNADRTSWSTAEDLGYNRTYTIVATDSEGQTTTATFYTTTPTEVADVALAPLPDSVVGVGQTIGFYFTSTVPDRQAAQDAITVTTDPPVEGAFFWLNNSTLRWRPAEYWTPGTKVTVKVDLYGEDLGDGVYGGSENETNFTIGDEVIAVADDNTKQLTISRNGVVERTMPISMGSAKFPTPNGTYMVGDHNSEMIMDSSSYGLAVDSPDGYRTKVQYATQMSWSGIYVHSAPWSIWAQGSQNVSHGCLNVSPDNAKWFLDNTKRGDIVMVRNTQGGTLSGYDGLGDWNIPWEEWKKGNADQTSAW